ncbi:site-specific DNA-methyltransferase [Lactobacillus psittaci]|uniref:Type III restriction-modification system n=1 Tax=Lactobacillus psittaci DSM 15354 TaxID=1122152 RepID=A0A0R1S1T5_9LACO|nr:type III restriction-modification system [Lactobacillus psittaci DSM 15354]
MQANYTGKIDIIYIDPPYNTGGDGFTYPDDFEYSDSQLKEMFGLDEDEVERMKSIQGSSSHSAWLTFMYPRIFLARHLLSNKGCFFMSIDDNELSNAKLMMDEIFGEKQYICIAPRKTGAGAAATRSDSELRKLNDYVLIYSKNIVKFRKKVVGVKEYPLSDKYGEYRLGQFQASGSDATRMARPNMYYPIYLTKDGRLTIRFKEDVIKTIFPSQVNGLDGRWMWKPEKFEKDNEKFIEYDGRNLKRKIYKNPLEDQTKYQVEKAWLEKYPNKNGTVHLADLLKKKGLFSNPKPVELIEFLLNLVDVKSPLILDFFAGSSTTAEATLRLNIEDGENRKFIMVQLPQKTYSFKKNGEEVPAKGTEAAYKAGFRSIDEISRERIRRAAAKIKEENELTLSKDFDGSFKHYYVVKPQQKTLDEINDFDPNNTDLFNNMLDNFSSKNLDVQGNAKGEDTVITTWLAKDGYQFDAPINKIDLAGYQGTIVDETRLYLIAPNWTSKNTQDLLNKLGTNQLTIQTVVIFGYSFNIAELKELETGLKQLDSNINLVKRY